MLWGQRDQLPELLWLKEEVFMLLQLCPRPLGSQQIFS